ncbi:MAG: hypothetical protein R3B09_02285 [Nannocystaceae bacterium]
MSSIKRTTVVVSRTFPRVTCTIHVLGFGLGLAAGTGIFDDDQRPHGYGRGHIRPHGFDREHLGRVGGLVSGVGRGRLVRRSRSGATDHGHSQAKVREPQVLEERRPRAGALERRAEFSGK